jgi:hypothetical protein
MWPVMYRIRRTAADEICPLFGAILLAAVAALLLLLVLHSAFKSSIASCLPASRSSHISSHSGKRVMSVSPIKQTVRAGTAETADIRSVEARVGDARRSLALPVLLAGAFLPVLDFNVVNLACRSSGETLVLHRATCSSSSPPMPQATFYFSSPADAAALGVAILGGVFYGVLGTPAMSHCLPSPACFRFGSEMHQAVPTFSKAERAAS